MLLTGADGGIGRSLAEAVARAGAAVALHSWHEGATDALCEELRAEGTRVTQVHGDVRSPTAVEDFVSAAEDGLDGLDGLVSNAGVMGEAPVLDMTHEEWRRVIETNLDGCFLVCQAAGRRMVAGGGGAVVTVASTRQVQAWPGSAAYAASKAAVASLTRSFALELAPYGVRVNSIAPGTFPTGLNRHYLGDPDVAAARIARIPAGRLGRTSELAGATIHLLSEEASFTTGASLMIDGGQTLW